MNEIRNINRRRFLQAAAGAMSVGAALPWTAGAEDRNGERLEPSVATEAVDGMKLSHRIDARAITDEDLRFLQQIGLQHVRAEFGPGPLSLADLRATQERLARFGLSIACAVYKAHASTKIQLGQPGRDQDIEAYQSFLRSLGQLKIPVAAYDFHPGNTYTTAMVQHRGYLTRQFSTDVFRARVEKPRFDREYSAEDMWRNYTYFFKAILPVAEAAGVKLALHPDDPPLAKMNGVAKLFTHYDGIARAEVLAAGSPNWGLCFCVGTWSEGGAAMGRDVFEMIRDFGGRNKIFDVHFRNVTSPLPSFTETLPDDGYQDMYAVMKALQAVNYRGPIEPDHLPVLEGDTGSGRAATAYCIAYIRALEQRARRAGNAEN